jgi:hypothetical protein
MRYHRGIRTRAGSWIHRELYRILDPTPEDAPSSAGRSALRRTDRRGDRTAPSGTFPGNGEPQRIRICAAGHRTVETGRGQNPSPLDREQDQDQPAVPGNVFQAPLRGDSEIPLGSGEWIFPKRMEYPGPETSLRARLSRIPHPASRISTGYSCFSMGRSPITLTFRRCMNVEWGSLRYCFDFPPSSVTQ